jgi:hypothetical protein
VDDDEGVEVFTECTALAKRALLDANRRPPTAAKPEEEDDEEEEEESEE